MPAYTTVLGLYKPGGGSTGDITPDEVVDIDQLNANADLIDAAVGFGSWTTATRPTTKFLGQTGYNSTLDIFERWNGSAWATFVPTYLGKTLITGYGTDISNLKATTTGTGSVVAGWTLNRFTLTKIGRLVQVDMSVNRATGASTITSGPTGNITNVQIGTVPTAFFPLAQYAGLTAGPGGPTSSIYVESDGKVFLAALPPSYSVTPGTELTAADTFLSKT